MADTRTLLEEKGFYHVYNHAVGNEQLFMNNGNYLFFMKLFKKYLSTYVDVYAYCLTPNHFHFIIKIKSKEEILANNLNNPTRVTNPRRVSQQTNPRRVLSKKMNIPLIISNQFSCFFNSYAQACNKERNRKGSLFNNRFKRKQITTEKYLIRLIHYIHYNPVAANLCNNIYEWRYSSYNAILSNNITMIERKKVIDLFNDKQNFINCHNVEPNLLGI